jgi:hypothetical protein
VKLGRFIAILDAYGAAPERWPERDRADALALARSSVAAARALAQVRALDEALRAFDAPALAAESPRFAALHDRILARARPLAKGFLGRWLGFEVKPAQLWPSVGGLALATMLGFAVGVAGLVQTDSASESDDSLIPTVDASISG